MIRFLQTPGPAKKIILGGLLLIVCVMMIITLVPGGMFGDYFGSTIDTQGVVAKVGDRRHHPATSQPACPHDRASSSSGATCLPH